MVAPLSFKREHWNVKLKREKFVRLQIQFSSIFKHIVIKNLKYC